LNAVADYAEATLDIRYVSEENSDDIKARLNGLLEKGVEIVEGRKGPSIANDTNNVYLQLYKKVLEEHLQEDVVFDFETGASDSRYFFTKDSVIIANQSDCGELHGDKEWLDLDKLQIFAETRRDFLERIANLSGGV
jgi:succinyl-diaminopimelate desuccinylase